MGTFITVGNGTQSFSRLFHAIATISPDLPQPVIVQCGHNEVELPNCRVFKFCDQNEFRKLIQENELVITHCGVGTILTALECGRRPVVVPRRAGIYAEIVNDHQLSLMKELSILDLISPVNETDELANAILTVVNSAETWSITNEETKKLSSGYLENINVEFQKHLSFNNKKISKICLVSACGGHLTELRKLKPLYATHDHFYVINNPIVVSDDMNGRTHVITLSERDWRAAINFFEAFRILLNEKPDIIVSTGAWPAIPFAIMGRLLGIPNLYIETMAIVDRPTMTGRIMYWLAHSFFYPWRQLQVFFPAGMYCGLLF